MGEPAAGTSAPPVGFLYDPFSAEAMADPLPLYRVLRDHHPVYRLDRYDAWALSRFDDVWAVGEDADRFSIVDGPVFERSALLSPHGGPPPSALTRPLPPFSSLDPPEQTRLRQAAGTPLRPRAVARLEDEIRGYARDRLDALVPRGAFDVVTEYAGWVSAAVMCRIVGLSGVDAAAVLDLVNRGMRREPGVPGVSVAGQAAREERNRLIVGLIRRRRAEDAAGDAAGGAGGGAGMVDGLIRAEIDGRPLEDDEIATQVGTIVGGGAETVPKVVGGGLLELWRRPEQLAAVRAGMPGSCADAYEEMVRYGGPLQWVGRTLRADAVVAGTPMRAGQRLFLLIPSANRDEREFADPDEFRWDRRPERHLAFGHGVHFCIGVHVARLEGRVLLEELLRRIPSYRIDEAGLERPPSEFQVGYTRVPLVVE